MEELKNCMICPRNCSVNRFLGKTGYCKSNASFNIASVCIHKGEEPVISAKKGICNVFFSHCNLQCIYCQNYQISSNKSYNVEYELELEQVIEKIITILDTGINIIGFVSPSHFIPQMKVIIKTLHTLGRKPVIVFNTNAYDKVITIQQLEGLIDVYLPDFKYMDDMLALKYSEAQQYPDIAKKSIKEMYRQKGSALIINNEGYAESGLIIRHLILPGHIQNSIDVLRFIAEEISTNVHISLMSQYYPTYKVAGNKTLGRQITNDEYFKVYDEMQRLGFSKGWVQDMESSFNYRPDFDNEQPFNLNNS
ncbi:MAG: 4Fe-4S cluster-binding domain-containing protein [Bacteroidales bacterium]|nr:4Fe-4S cluster-binding domain-containing protein [Bacteroidales bacterium]